jgi:hypothetical protein
VVDEMCAEETCHLAVDEFGIKIALNLLQEPAGITEAIAPHAREAVYPHLASVMVVEHEAIPVPTRGETPSF